MMKNITNPKLHLKAIPFIAMLALGMAFAPMSAMAGSGDRGHHKAEQSKNVGKHHNRGHYRSEKHAYKEPRHNSHRRNVDRNHKRKLNHEYGTRYGRHHNKHVRHYPRYDHHYDHRGHGTTHYVINDYHHKDRYVDYDHLGFMIGLHTNNFDITFRD
jgi:hypothetical protein